MSILTTSTVTAIDTQKIAKGDFIRAKYAAWKKAHNGIVARVTTDEIRVLYIGDGGNVTNYFAITAEEIKDGLWTLSWSADLTETEYDPEPDPDPEEEGDEQ